MASRLVALVLALGLVLGVSFATAIGPETEAANAAVDYIRSLQNSDGGFPVFGVDSSPGGTLDAVFALSSSGEDPTSVTTGGNSPAEYLAGQAASYINDPGAAAKLALGVSVMGLDPSNFGGEDLISSMAANFDPSTGSNGFDLFDEALYMLALTREGLPIPAAATTHVLSLQLTDGAWEFGSSFGSDSNTTSIVLQTLLAVGVDPLHSAVLDGLTYLQKVQNPDGGFGFVVGSDSDPNSTAFVVQALVATSQKIKAAGTWAPGGNTSLDGLLEFRNDVTGAFQFFGSDSPFATYQAVPALMLAPFPSLQTIAVGGVAEVPEAPRTSLQQSETTASGGGSVAVVVLTASLGVAGIGGLTWIVRRRRAA